MDSRKYVFVAGLPRSGSTLLESILSQNPDFYTELCGPLYNFIESSIDVFKNTGLNFSYFDEDRKTDYIKSIFFSYYKNINKKVIFDFNRPWMKRLDLLYKINPNFKMILCVRDIGWILDSLEIYHRSNLRSNLYNSDRFVESNVITRVNSLLSHNGLVGENYNLLLEVMYSNFKNRLLLVDYESYQSNAESVLSFIYDFIEEPFYHHDLKNVEKNHNDYDSLLQLPTLHSVRKEIIINNRTSILPPEIWNRVKGMEIWKNLES